LQAVFLGREDPSPQEIEAEAEWIFQRLVLLLPSLDTPETRYKVSFFLNLYRVEKFEIEFIRLYRAYRLEPQIPGSRLPELARYDKEWG
jgi:hypothetical protein